MELISISTRIRLSKFNIQKRHVYAGEARVAAIGTAFSVKLEGESIDVIVSEGKIRFDRVGETSGKTLKQVEKIVKVDTPVFMEAGQSMEFENQVQKVAEIAIWKMLLAK